MEILAEKLFHIDRDNIQISEREISSTDVLDYTNYIMEMMLKKDNSRVYVVKNSDTQVVSCSNNIILDIVNERMNNQEIATTVETGKYQDKKFSSIAERLLDVEIKYNDKIIRTNREMKKGSLLFAVIRDAENDRFMMFISKVEHEEFLETDQLKKKSGLSYSKALHRSCCIYYNSNLEIENIKLFDSKPTILKHWWDDFLELQEAESDYYNTQKAYESMKNYIDIKFRKSPSDHVQLISNLKNYYKTKSSFNYDDAVEYVIGEYQPSDDCINVEEVRNELNQLPEKLKFDKKFNIDLSPIKTKLNQKFKVNDKITLDFQAEEKNILHFIKAYKEDDGTKYLTIRDISDEAYKQFKCD